MKRIIKRTAHKKGRKKKINRIKSLKVLWPLFYTNDYFTFAILTFNYELIKKNGKNFLLEKWMLFDGEGMP